MNTAEYAEGKTGGQAKLDLYRLQTSPDAFGLYSFERSPDAEWGVWEATTEKLAEPAMKMLLRTLLPPEGEERKPDGER